MNNEINPAENITNLIKAFHSPSRRLRWIWLIIIAFLFISIWALIYFLQEPAQIVTFLFTIPIILTSIMFKTMGGIITALLTGMLLLSFTVTPNLFPLSSDIIIFARPHDWALAAAVMLIIGILSGSTFDIVDRQLEEMEEVLLNDPDSGLPNSSALINTVNQLNNKADKRNACLVLIEIKNFPDIINSIGHEKSGDFLRKASHHLRRKIEKQLAGHSSDLKMKAFNIYNDKLGFLLKGIDLKREMLVNLIGETESNLEASFYREDIPVYIDTRLGIARRESGDTGRDLLEKAHMAMISTRNKSKLKFYDDELENRFKNNIFILGEFREALKEGQFHLKYMPKIELSSEKITSAEALIRWDHPGRGLIPPNKFIPQLEKTALINELSQWVFKRAAEDLLLFQEEGLEIKMSVNISPYTLKRNEFWNTVETTLKETALSPNIFELELTETDVIEKLTEGRNALNVLAHRGFKIALDDFGTGHSSLNYLKNLHFDILKIDISFVRDMHKNRENREIVKTAIRLGHQLNKEVVAEGIENEEILEKLKKLGCDYGQGYHISKPLPREQFIELYNRR